MRRRECNQKKEGGGVLGVIGRKVGGKMRGSKRRRRRGGGRRKREEEEKDGWMKEDSNRWRERRRRSDRKAVNINGLERYAILSKVLQFVYQITDCRKQVIWSPD